MRKVALSCLNIHQRFDDLVYTRKIKKKKASKKISRKHVKAKKASKAKKEADERVKDIDNKKDTRSSEGADTQKAATEEVMDTNNFEGEDTLELVEKKTTVKKKKKTQEWTEPRRKPTETEERRLFGKALEIMLITCMNNHLYKFDNKIEDPK